MTAPNPCTCTADELRQHLAGLLAPCRPLRVIVGGGGLQAPRVAAGDLTWEFADLMVLPRAYVEAMVRLLGPAPDPSVLVPAGPSHGGP